MVVINLQERKRDLMSVNIRRVVIKALVKNELCADTTGHQSPNIRSRVGWQCGLIPPNIPNL